MAAVVTMWLPFFHAHRTLQRVSSAFCCSPPTSVYHFLCDSSASHTEGHVNAFKAPFICFLASATGRHGNVRLHVTSMIMTRVYAVCGCFHLIDSY